MKKTLVIYDERSFFIRPLTSFKVDIFATSNKVRTFVGDKKFITCRIKFIRR